jgi:hypothetical protein
MLSLFTISNLDSDQLIQPMMSKNSIAGAAAPVSWTVGQAKRSQRGMRPGYKEDAAQRLRTCCGGPGRWQPSAALPAASHTTSKMPGCHHVQPGHDAPPD